MKLSQFRVPPATCPHCRRGLDGATELESGGGLPKPNDITLCAYCATVLVFNHDLTLRPAGGDDLSELSPAQAETVKQAESALRRFLEDWSHG